MLCLFLLFCYWAGQSAQLLLSQWVSRERQQRTRRLTETSMTFSTILAAVAVLHVAELEPPVGPVSHSRRSLRRELEGVGEEPDLEGRQFRFGKKSHLGIIS